MNASRTVGKSLTKLRDEVDLAHNHLSWIFEFRGANMWFGTQESVVAADVQQKSNGRKMCRSAGERQRSGISA